MHLMDGLEEIQPPYLQSSQLRLGRSTEKGRGVYATREIKQGTVIEVSQVLLFDKDEYRNHGRHTLLDHYTFNWPDGRMALALGLGSLFNHSDTPNTSFSIDTSTGTIRYTVSRLISPGDELCIFYGHQLWFRPAGAAMKNEASYSEPEDDWNAINSILSDQNPFLDGNPSGIVPESELPFRRTKVTPDDEDEDDEGSIRTMDVWVVDIPDPKAISAMLKWVKSEGLETPDLAHLKRIRRQDATSTLLLTGAPTAPPIPATLGLPVPYQIAVPTSPALTMKSLKLKLQLWPIIYAPRRKGEAEPWSRARAAWAWEAVQQLKKVAEVAKAAGELPIVSYLPRRFVDSDRIEPEDRIPSFVAHDTRHSSSHPLRHSAVNVIRKVAEWRASVSPQTDESVIRCSELSSAEQTPNGRASTDNIGSDGSRVNGTHYLLTSLTLFTTHEPCIMCSMALLHSRVREVFFLQAMDATGGCGGHDGRGVCIPRLKGVNHRFSIMQWKREEPEEWAPLLGSMEGVDA